MRRDGVESDAKAHLAWGRVGDKNMTMKERLASAINSICCDRTILNLDEAGIRARVIDHLFALIEWQIFDQNEFKREYPVPGGRVDYALLVNGDPKVFIEAKSPREDLGSHEDQLVTYSAKRGVPLAALTNGLNWWLYLPLKEGEFEARRFCELDINKHDVSEVCERLIEFLARENVYSGAAVENAERRLKSLHDARKVNEALPQVWEELIAGPDDLLADLINERVKGRYGIEAAPERIKGFLVGLGKPVHVAKQPTKKKEMINTREARHISSRLSDFDLSKLDNVSDEDLLHATLSNIVDNYTDAKNINERNIRATVRERMSDRGFIEFDMLAEWGGVKSQRKRFCKINICNAKHADNRRK